MEGLTMLFSTSNIVFTTIFIATYLCMYFLHKQGVRNTKDLLYIHMLDSDTSTDYENIEKELRGNTTVTKWILRGTIVLFILAEVLLLLSAYFPVVSCN